MLIVPVSRSPDWRNPPWITLLLILINALIFFGLQSNDQKHLYKAYQHYGQSSLWEIEPPRYLEYLKKQGSSRQAERLEKALDSGNGFRLLLAMERDREFMKRLLDNEIIRPDEEVFKTWRADRDRFEKLKNVSMSDRFGFKPAAPTVAGLIGHMFLHGSFDHLLGNMVILFVVGYMVEEALGKSRYLLFYLLAGIGAAGFDLVFNADRMIPGIGASGAISGVMAMYVALYGMRKIRFFYWIFVYFDFFRAPALVILPFWIANELYQYFFSHGSPVNYMAHLGGFVTGALLILLYKYFGRGELIAPEQEVPVDKRPEQMRKVDALLGALKLDEARNMLKVMADKHPEDLEIVVRYFKVSAHAPASEDFHRAAALIFSLPDGHPAINEIIYETFTEYLKKAKPGVRLNTKQLSRLTRRLALGGYPADAGRLLKALEKRADQVKDLPNLMLLVAASFRKAGNSAMQEEVLLRLQQAYPESEAARSLSVVTR